MKKVTVISNYVSLALILSILSYFAFSAHLAKNEKTSRQSPDLYFNYQK